MAGLLAMEVLAVISLSASVLALLLAARVLAHPSDNPPAAWSLAIFLFSAAAFIADQAAYAQDWFAVVPHAYGVANPLIVCLFPSLFLYVRGVTEPTRRWPGRTLLHFAPPLIVALAEAPGFLMTAEEKTAEARRQISGVSAAGEEMLFLILLNVYGLAYLLAAWGRVRQGRYRLQASQEEGRAGPVRGLEVFVAAVCCLTALSAVLDLTPWRFTGGMAIALAAVMMVFSIFWLLADHQPLLLGGRPGAAPPVAPTEAPPEGVANPGAEVAVSPEEERTDAAVPPALRPEERQRLKRRLEKLLDEEKVYLDSELSLQVLATRAETTRHKLSAVMREGFGLTFYQLVARYRVREAAIRLRGKAGASQTISSIAFAVGFNTLSAFNTAFKQEFGVTPSRYRESKEG